jgi:hypothetical protein
MKYMMYMEKNNNTNKKREKYLLRIEELGCIIEFFYCVVKICDY